MGGLELRPVYVKVKKQYTTGEAHSSDCMWMQLLEVAYAAAGFSHGESEVKEDGELVDLNKELTDGVAYAALMHLTGRKYESLSITNMAAHTIEQSDIDQSGPGMYIQKHMMLSGVDEHLRDHIYRQLDLVKRNAIKNGDVIDEKWEENAVKTAVLKGLEASVKTSYEWRESLETLVSQGKLTKIQKNVLVEKIEKRYYLDEKDRAKQAETITDRILRNIKKPGTLPTRPPKGYRPLSHIASDICQLARGLEQQPAEAEQKPAEAGLQPAEGEQKPAEVKEQTAYERILESIDKKVAMSGNAPEKKPSEGQIKATKFSVKNFMALNPENRYTQRELGILTILRRQVAKGRAVCFEDQSHTRTILDTKFHNGKWFVLVRDPFNVYRNEYSTKENGIKTKSYGLGTTLIEHFTVRDLSTDLRMGFLGTSWYELKDIAKEVQSVQFRAEEDNGFADGFDAQ